MGDDLNGLVGAGGEGSGFSAGPGQQDQQERPADEPCRAGAQELDPQSGFGISQDARRTDALGGNAALELNQLRVERQR